MWSGTGLAGLWGGLGGVWWLAWHWLGIGLAVAWHSPKSNCANCCQYFAVAGPLASHLRIFPSFPLSPAFSLLVSNVLHLRFKPSLIPHTPIPSHNPSRQASLARTSNEIHTPGAWARIHERKSRIRCVRDRPRGTVCPPSPSTTRPNFQRIARIGHGQIWPRMIPAHFGSFPTTKPSNSRDWGFLAAVRPRPKCARFKIRRHATSSEERCISLTPHPSRLPWSPLGDAVAINRVEGTGFSVPSGIL